jgi:hypothetical protein
MTAESPKKTTAATTGPIRIAAECNIKLLLSSIKYHEHQLVFPTTQHNRDTPEETLCLEFGHDQARSQMVDEHGGWGITFGAAEKQEEDEEGQERHEAPELGQEAHGGLHRSAASLRRKPGAWKPGKWRGGEGKRGGIGAPAYPGGVPSPTPKAVLWWSYCGVTRPALHALLGVFYSGDLRRRRHICMEGHGEPTCPLLRSNGLADLQSTTTLFLLK